MKLYTKVINNIKQVLPLNKIVLINDSVQIFNPTEEMLLADGWMEYIAPNQELSEEQILEQEKSRIIDDIMCYDSSESVNAFYVNNMAIWLDKATRAGLMLRFQAEISMGKTNTILWYNNIEFPLTLESAIQMLYALEMYASECYDNTQRHISNIEKIISIDDLKSYDYTVGYPEKLRF